MWKYKSLEHYKPNGSRRRKFNSYEEAKVAANIIELKYGLILKPDVCKICKCYHLYNKDGIKRKSIN